MKKKTLPIIKRYKDCKVGTLYLDSKNHTGYVIAKDDDGKKVWIELISDNENGRIIK